MSLQASSRKLYDNISVHHPDGWLMFKCHSKRAAWYLSRKLAVVINEDPLVLQLQFHPDGVGNANDPYYLQDMQNKCCVCGTEYELTIHHVVPWCYRRFFPLKLKDRCAHDCLCVCVGCHEKYERHHADKMKSSLSKKYNIPPNGIGWIGDAYQGMSAMRAARALLNYGHVIPQHRHVVLKQRIRTFINAEPTEDDILRIGQMTNMDSFKTHDYKTCGQLIVEIVLTSEEKLLEFTKMWRRHFIDNMCPKHLPELWDINREVGRIE